MCGITSFIVIFLIFNTDVFRLIAWSFSKLTLDLNLIFLDFRDHRENIRSRQNIVATNNKQMILNCNKSECLAKYLTISLFYDVEYMLPNIIVSFIGVYSKVSMICTFTVTVLIHVTPENKSRALFHKILTKMILRILLFNWFIS